MRTIRVERFSSSKSEAIRKRRHSTMLRDQDASDYVRKIIGEVRGKGDEALIALTRKYDEVDLTDIGIKVTRAHIKKALKKVGKEQVEVLTLLRDRLREIEGHKLRLLNYTYREEGLTITHTLKPISSVGCYIPGGKASYPSTLVMTVVPAKVAGVPRIVICSPPTYKGDISPHVLVAADICGVDEVYRLGGAQAIAAMAYGTGSVNPVMKIFGPGSRSVTLAKLAISREVAIDVPAGPSELIVLADESADPTFIAWDIISQSEHAPDNMTGLVTTSENLAYAVLDQLEKLTDNLNRKEIVTQSLSENGFIVLCETIDDAVGFINSLGPEHLEIMMKDPEEVAKMISSAGIILLGDHTPASASDYCIGTNHVLPTSGFSRVYSELSIFDYVKRVNIVKCTKDRLRKMKSMARALSDMEGLPNHFLALQERMRDR